MVFKVKYLGTVLINRNEVCDEIRIEKNLEYPYYF
jgi:hypothetical protein